MTPKLFKPSPSLIKPQGWLKWADVIAAVRALKGAGKLKVKGGKVTETANGVNIQVTRFSEPGETPFDAVASADFKTRITPGIIFAGSSFVIPTLGGISIASPDAPTITGYPRRIYIKFTWRSVIANDYDFGYNTDTSSYDKYDSVRFPEGIEIISAEIVSTDEDSPEAAGWTPPGETQVSEVIRETESVVPNVFSRTATNQSNGIAYELIATRDDDWTEEQDHSEIYPDSEEAPYGGYGHRLIRSVGTFGGAAISPGVDDSYLQAFITGISI